MPVPDKGLAAAAATESGSAVAEKTGEGKTQVEKPTFAAVDFKTAAETGGEEGVEDKMQKDVLSPTER